MLKQTLILLLNEKVKNKKRCSLAFMYDSESALYRTYNDSNGQRQAYLTYFAYGEEENTTTPDRELYQVRRHCTFVNKDDEGKQGAVLGVLNLQDVKDEDIMIRINQVQIKDLIITFAE